MKLFKIIIASVLAFLLLGAFKAGIAQTTKEPILLEPRNPSEQFIFLTDGNRSMIICPIAKLPLNCIDDDGNSVTKNEFVTKRGFSGIISYERIVLNSELYYLMKVLN